MFELFSEIFWFKCFSWRHLYSFCKRYFTLKIVFLTKSPLFDKIIFLISHKIILQELWKKYVNCSGTEPGWFGLLEVWKFYSVKMLSLVSIRDGRESLSNSNLNYIIVCLFLGFTTFANYISFFWDDTWLLCLCFENNINYETFIFIYIKTFPLFPPGEENCLWYISFYASQ